MIVKFLGFFDIFVGVVFWIFGIFHVLPESFVFILGLFLLAKGVAFATNLNVTSILDIVSAVIIVSATSVIMPQIIVILVTLFLLQKGIFSLLG